MNKLTILVAIMMVAGVFSDCLVNTGEATGSKCLVCGAGKMVDAAGACVAGKTDCAFSAGMTSGAIPMWCDICSGGKFQQPDGSCVAAPTTVPTADQNTTCWAIVDGTAWSCIGCKAGTYNTIEKTKCSQATTAATTPMVLFGTAWKACNPNMNSNADNSACTPNTPPYTGLEQSSSGKLYWTTSNNEVIKIATDGMTTLSKTGYDANCWFTNSADNCIKCKPNTIPKWEAVGAANPKTLKVTCSAYSVATDTSGSGSGLVCRAWYTNGTSNTCAQCANKANALSATFKDNGTCDWAAANKTETKSASIVGFSAILLLVVSRLF